MAFKRQAPVDKQQIVSGCAAEGHVSSAVGYRRCLKAVLTDQHVLVDGDRASDVKAIPHRRSEAWGRAKGVGQPALCYAHQNGQGAFRDRRGGVESRAHVPAMNSQLLEPESHVVTQRQYATTMEAGLVPVRGVQAQQDL